MKTWMHDLRFFIGAFFLIVGAILSLQGLLDPTPVEGVNLNLYAGLGFILFSGGAFLSLQRA
jgi:hypothetical protein